MQRPVGRARDSCRERLTAEVVGVPERQAAGLQLVVDERRSRQDILVEVQPGEGGRVGRAIDVNSEPPEGAGDRDKGDAKKVLEFTQQFPDIDQALAKIYEFADEADEETQSLLRTIAQDERSTLDFFADACAQLNPS